jgi:hypothetical protein
MIARNIPFMKFIVFPTSTSSTAKVQKNAPWLLQSIRRTVGCDAKSGHVRSNSIFTRTKYKSLTPPLPGNALSLGVHTPLILDQVFQYVTIRRECSLRAPMKSTRLHSRTTKIMWNRAFRRQRRKLQLYICCKRRPLMLHHCWPSFKDLDM